MTAPAQAVDPVVIARLAKRFAGNPRTRANHARWAAWAARAALPPWELIQKVLDQAQADGLNTRQQAAGVYSIMVARGLVSEGRA
ncbi:hypothetical protein [Methylobacterium sp. WL7]|jgi:hypothetical protein|uniref:hypothetical protein n=1 Tax=Methylobacterium sp. WL7 TaxID=2603900 RepID=UPI0011CA3DB6|nr:hypothetical protein [Methylobacterium sp. WL7]TXN47344.1 hypothetical protein FV233_04760 [Methylobacterium sp. WL7]